MAVPDYQACMLPVLQAATTQISTPESLEAAVSQHFSLSDADRDLLLPSGRQRIISNRIHWARYYLEGAGLIERVSRGRYQTTPAGRTYLQQHPGPISIEALLQHFPRYAEFLNRRKGAGAGEAPALPSHPSPQPAASRTPEERIAEAHLELTTALQQSLLARILEGNPQRFEQLVVDLLVTMGYGGSHQAAATRLGRSGDGGVDGVIAQDPLGIDQIYVQAKRYAPDTPIGRPVVQGFAGALLGQRATKGVFVTTSSFTDEAVRYAQTLTQRVILIDGRQLTGLMIQHGLGTRTVERIEVKRLDEDYFLED